ncbi:MAG: hypothetical protein K2H21_01400, partial [Muribaculaceae bacterium]|nr:hypothetical protein [Muribaculaceae bacterium]
MYYGKTPLHSPEKYAATRRELTSYRNGSIFIALQELGGSIGMHAIARDYFHQSPEWIDSKIKESTTERPDGFTAEEARQLA